MFKTYIEFVLKSCIINFIGCIQKVYPRFCLSWNSQIATTMLLKNTVYDKLVAKVNTIDTKIPNANGLVFKTLYDSDKKCLEKKIKDIEENTFKICLS